MYVWLLIGLVTGAEIALGISPKADRLTWTLENFPVWIGLVLLAATNRSFPLSRLCLTLLAIHAFILMIGGYYTYAKVPLGFWLKNTFHLSRNDYDRLGHFVQGFVPAILVRELLLRRAGLARNNWLAFLTISVCLAFSACYELIEWGAALLTGEKATDFLATQGDAWDTQWDMFTALIGAIAALLILSPWHDQSLERLKVRSEAGLDSAK